MADKVSSVSNLYKAFVDNGYDMEPYEDFCKNLKNPKARRAAYDALVADGYGMESYEDFERNIGFGAPVTPATGTRGEVAKPTAQQTAQQPTQPTADSAAVQPTAQQPTADSATAQQPEGEPLSEQEKIARLAQIDAIKRRSDRFFKDAGEQRKRAFMGYTPEGRKELREREKVVRALGGETKLMGYAPAPSEGGQGGEQSGVVPTVASPRAWSTKIVGGKRVTEWLMPDGSLTTDRAEAEHMQYYAREKRFQDEFVSRMRSNGLDPSKEEDVEKQVRLDYEAPMRKVLDSVWAQAEEEDRAADEEYLREMKKQNKSFRSNVRALDPGGMALPTSMDFQRDYERAVKRKETFNLESIANKVLNELPASYRQQSLQMYQQYFSAHTNELNGRSVQQAAQDALRSEVYNAVYQRAVDSRMPKSKTEFLIRKIADQPFINPYQAMDMAASSTTHSWGMNAADIDAMNQFGQQQRALDITGTILNMAIDPTVYFSGGVGSAAGKQALKGVSKQMIKGATKEMSKRYAARTLTGRVFVGATGGAANFATFESLKNIQGQMAVGGVVNPETGEREFSFGDVLESAVHGLILGGVTGSLSPIIGNFADKATKATTSTLGKTGVRAGELVVGTVADGTIFSTWDWIAGNGDPWDVWTDNMAMMLGFKASHGVKVAPRVIANMRPIKPTQGQPLTQAEIRHNQMSFEERWRKILDPANLTELTRNDGGARLAQAMQISKAEREELRRNGYGELADVFERLIVTGGTGERVKAERIDVELGEKRIVDVPVFDENGNVIGTKKEEVQDKVRQTPVPQEYDGYEIMERLIKDERVSEATRAKIHYLFTGHKLPMSTIVGWDVITGEDGSYIVNSKNAEGGIVTHRRFKNKREAEAEQRRIQRQAELNSIEVGERASESRADRVVFEAAVEDAYPGADADVVMDVYMRVRRGDKDVTESMREQADKIDEAVERNKDAGDEYRPEAMRRRIKEETGIDVDEVIRKRVLTARRLNVRLWMLMRASCTERRVKSGVRRAERLRRRSKRRMRGRSRRMTVMNGVRSRSAPRLMWKWMP